MRVHYLTRRREEEAERAVRRGSPQPCRLLSKEEQEECWSRSRVSDAKHNTAFTAGGHLHNAREEKKCTLLCQQLFQYYGNALFGKKGEAGGGGVAQWWSFVCLAHTHSDDVGRCPRVARAHICDACVAALAGSLRGIWASLSAYGAAVYPLSVCCQLSEWKLPFQSSEKKAPGPKRSPSEDTLRSPHCLLNEAKPAAQRQSVNKRAAQWRFY